MRIIDADRYQKDLLSAYDDLSMELEVLDIQPLVQAISLDKVKQAREEIESNKNTTSMLDCAKFYNNGLDKALEILDKLTESEE